MTFKILLLALASALALTTLAGAGDPPAAALTAKPAAQEEAVLVGPTTREKVEASPEWVQAEVDARPDAGAAQALGTVEPGAEVTIFLGTWCGDSRREVPRFWKALDAAEGGTGAVPFQVRYVAVDHDKRQPADLLKESDVRYLPTLIVRRGGREVGRIVESSPHGVEQDLLALLTGKASGVLSNRQDLAPANPHPQG
jgi:thiol-disulfide isomerase/thioredoxin